MSQAGRDECQTFPVATLNNNDRRSKVAMANPRLLQTLSHGQCAAAAIMILARQRNQSANSKPLTTQELRRTKATRDEFSFNAQTNYGRADGVVQNHNIDTIFRLCDAFLVQELVVCGAKVELHKRRLVQAAQGTQHWVPWSERQHAGEAVAESKGLDAWVVVAEQTTASVRPEQLVPVFPVTLVLGGERTGASPEVIGAADAAVTIPMLGMANSLNVATAAAILLYWLSLQFEENIGP